MTLLVTDVVDFLKLDATPFRRRNAAAAAASWGNGPGSLAWAAPSTGEGSAAVATADSDGEPVAVPTTVGVAVPAEVASSSGCVTREAAALLDDSATGETLPASVSRLGACQACHSPPTLKPWNALGATAPAGDRERAVGWAPFRVRAPVAIGRG